MKKMVIRKGNLKRIMCALLASATIVGGLTACGTVADVSTDESGISVVSTDTSVQDNSTKDDNTANADTMSYELPAAVFSSDIQYVKTLGEGKEIAQQITFKSSAEIDGTITAEDITLKGSFEGMKVSNISNDTESITLTVSGVPVFNGGSIIDNVGRVEINGKYFDSEKPVEAGVYVANNLGGAVIDGGYFYPYFDSLIDNGDTNELHIMLHAYAAVFKDGFGIENITLGSALEGATIVSLEKVADDEYELVLNVSEEIYNTADDTVYGTIDISKGSLVDENGKENAEDLSYTRDFSKRTIGRSFSNEELDQIKNVVKPKKDPSFTDILADSPIGEIFNIGMKGYSYYGTAMSAYKAVVGMYAAFGLIDGDSGPSIEEIRHQEIMDALSDISDQVQAVQEDVTAIRDFSARTVRSLEHIQVSDDEKYLTNFNSVYGSMISMTNELDKSLKKNKEYIKGLIEAADDTEKEMTDEEITAVLGQFSDELSKMSSNASYRNCGTLAQEVDQLYKKAIQMFVDYSSGNPINVFCDKYAFIDNFATTSITDKEAFVLDLQCQFDRTLSYLKLFGGPDSQEVNEGLFREAKFPNVREGIMNSAGDPYCYLMQDFVRVANDTVTKVYGPLKDNKVGSKFTILQEENVKEFVKRMNGRTLREELLLAGIKEETFADKKTNFAQSNMELAQYKDFNTKKWGPFEYDKNFCGISFEYTIHRASDKDVDGSKKSRYLYSYARSNAGHNFAWSDNYGFWAEKHADDPEADRTMAHTSNQFDNVPNDSDAKYSFIITSNSIFYGDKANYESTDVFYAHKTLATWYGKGWYVGYPMQYLVKVGNK